jgi:hypothetical protein
MNFRRYWMKIPRNFQNPTGPLCHHHPLIHNRGHGIYLSPTGSAMPLHISKSMLHIRVSNSSPSTDCTTLISPIAHSFQAEISDVLHSPQLFMDDISRPGEQLSFFSENSDTRFYATGPSVNTQNSSSRTSFLRGRHGRSPVPTPDPVPQEKHVQPLWRSRRLVKLTEKARFELHGHSLG